MTNNVLTLLKLKRYHVTINICHLCKEGGKLDRERLNLPFIAKRRSECKLTLQEMAESLGFRNASTYLKYEKGEYDFKANHGKETQVWLARVVHDYLFVILAKIH